MINIDFKCSKPIYEQVVIGIKDLIFKEIIKAEEKLPSVRELANILMINPNTVSRAYLELEREEIIESRKGSGTFVRLVGKNTLIEERKIHVIEAIKRVIFEAKILKYSEEDILLLVENTLKEIGGKVHA